MKTEFEKSQSAKILAAYGIDINKSEDLDIEKSKGEGSRGGNVIGHTKSGKPIYDKFNHKDHDAFRGDDETDFRRIFSEHHDKKKQDELDILLPENTQELVDAGKVTYRGGDKGTRIKVGGKEYYISDKKFKELGGIAKIKFNAPARKD